MRPIRHKAGTRPWLWPVFAIATCTAVVSACNDIIGIDDYTFGANDAGSGAGGQSGGAGGAGGQSSATAGGQSGGAPSCADIGATCTDEDPCTTNTCVEAYDEFSGNYLGGQCIAPAHASGSASTGFVWAQPVCYSCWMSGAEAFAVTPSGETYWAGPYSEQLDLAGMTLTSAGQTDIFLAKFNTQGKVAWAASFGDEKNNLLNYTATLAVDSSGDAILAISLVEGDIDFGGGTLAQIGVEDLLIAKFSSSGQHIWSRRIGTPNVSGLVFPKLAVDVLGNIAVAVDPGAVLTATVEPTGQSVIVAPSHTDGKLIFKLNSSGTVIATKLIRNTSFFNTDSIAFDPLGSLLLAVTTQNVNPIDLGGGPIGPPNGKPFVLTAKLDSNLGFMWARLFEGTNVRGAEVVHDPNGQVLLAGTYDESITIGNHTLSAPSSNEGQMFVAALDDSGTVLSTRNLDINSTREWVIDGTGAMIRGAHCQYLTDITAWKLDKNAFNSEAACVAKFSPSGELLWSVAAVGSDRGSRLGFDAVGNVYFGAWIDTNTLQGQVDFGGGLTPASKGLYLMKYAP